MLFERWRRATGPHGWLAAPVLMVAWSLDLCKAKVVHPVASAATDWISAASSLVLAAMTGLAIFDVKKNWGFQF